jgi:hypothetical protein
MRDGAVPGGASTGRADPEAAAGGRESGADSAEPIETARLSGGLDDGLHLAVGANSVLVFAGAAPQLASAQWIGVAVTSCM